MSTLQDRKKKILLYAVLSAAAILAVFLAWNAKKAPQMTEPEPVATPEIIIADAERNSTTIPQQENPNCLFTVNPSLQERSMLTADGTSVPDIMSGSVMKSGSRSIPRRNYAYEEETFCVSGPHIVINGHEIPENSFYALTDLYCDTCEYMICAGCFRDCGFDPNTDLKLTLYDFVTNKPEHDYMVSVDELEMHTTWTLDKYDAESNTYHFTVSQDGPFSGTSDIFGVIKKGDRYNTMPIAESSSGTFLTPYREDNDYWNDLDYTANQLRVRINYRFGTQYKQIQLQPGSGEEKS